MKGRRASTGLGGEATAASARRVAGTVSPLSGLKTASSVNRIRDSPSFCGAIGFAHKVAFAQKTTRFAQQVGQS
jgi:hypothetical protein